MCRCDICKRRSRTVTIISQKVVCMVCLSFLLDGVEVMVRGQPGDLVAVLDSHRYLTIRSRLAEPVPEIPVKKRMGRPPKVPAGV